MPEDFLLIGAQEPMRTRLADNSNVFAGIPPYFMPYGKDFIKISKNAYNFPVYALPVLAACLRKKGISLSCINDFYSELPDVVTSAIRNTRYAVCISTTFLTNSRSIVKIAKFVRHVNPALKIIMGGPGIINFPKTRRFADINIFYEGEETIQELAPMTCLGQDVSKVKGISYFNGSEEIYTDARKPIEDLGNIPIPYWSALSKKIKEERYLPIESSRGCIGRCAFCLETRYWPGVRLYPIERVIKEIKNNISRFSIRHYYFQDSNMCNKRTYLASLCDALHREDLGIRWSCESRIDTITKELVDKMRKAGCRAITFGMESADPRILRNMNKNISDKKMKAFLSIVKYMRKRGLIANINVIVGFPGEDKHSIKRTIEFLLEAKPVAYSMSKFFLERGADIWKDRARYGLKGSMHRWKHRTMQSSQLDDILRHIFLTVSKELGIYHWSSASVDLIRHMGKGKRIGEFVKFLKCVNQICVEDLRRGKAAYSNEYDRSFRYITKFLS